MRYSFVLLAGAVIGAVVCLVFGSTLPAAAIGSLVGGVFAYITYDAPTFIRAVPHAARKAAVGIPEAYRAMKNRLPKRIANWRWYATRGWLWFFILESAVLAIVFVDVDPIYMNRVMMLSCAVLMLHVMAGIIMLLSTMLIGDVKRAAEETHEPYGFRLVEAMERHSGITVDWNKFFFEDAPHTMHTVKNGMMGYLCTVLIITLVPLEAVLLVAKEIALMIGGLIIGFIKLLLLVLVAILKFGWNLFVKIHSEMRLMAFVDTASGVLIGYAVQWWQHGENLAAQPTLTKLTFIATAAILALAFGTVNHQLVAKRWLRLSPS